MKERIEEGDIVNIFFNTADAIFDAIILKTSVATGDCFVVKDKNDVLYNVQQYNYMELVKSKE